MDNNAFKSKPPLLLSELLPPVKPLNILAIAPKSRPLPLDAVDAVDVALALAANFDLAKVKLDCIVENIDEFESVLLIALVNDSTANL